MKRKLVLIVLAGLLAVGLTTVAACGDDGDGGLSVLDDDASPAPSASDAPVGARRPSHRPHSDEPEPVMSGEGEDPFDDYYGAATAADLEAYLAAVKPIFKETTRIDKIAGAMLDRGEPGRRRLVGRRRRAYRGLRRRRSPCRRVSGST